VGVLEQGAQRRVLWGFRRAIFVHVGSQKRIVATISDAGDTCAEEETHARADTKYVQDWIKDTIAAH
jgi:hypothetical protein